MARLLYIITAIIVISSLDLNGQELDCRVEVNASRLERTNKSVFETLQDAINEYVNSKKWTDSQFSINERVECSMFFDITEYDQIQGRMSGTLQVQSVRPVYNSSYTTTLLNMRDTHIEFNYLEGEPLVYNEVAMESQLTQILNYYIYLILAVDYDSFSLHGGDPYYSRLAMIVQQAQSLGASGWKAFEDNKNRSAVLNAFTDMSTRRFRDLLYEYHRNGLDQMSVNPDKGRKIIDSSINILQEISRMAPMTVALSIFRDAKLDELVNIYSKATPDERTHAYGLLNDIYPTDQDRLQQILDPDKNKQH